jgi:solute carrier family 35 protein E2
MCIVGGYFHTKVPLGMISSATRVTGDVKLLSGRTSYSRLYVLVGCLRFSTLVFGLVALWFAPVSFAETVKSAAPVFTVILSCLILGEKCSLLLNLSLIPVVFGLVLCSAYELSFNLQALAASLAANLSECLQNVFSKKLLMSDRLDPQHLQFLTSLSSLLIQVPCVLLLVDLNLFWTTVTSDSNILLSYILNGISFHCQSLSEYMLLSQISPVTHSVANTTKRALLILLSVKTFGNEVTLQSWIGTAILFFGVFLYNKAKDRSRQPTSYADAASISQS